MEFWSLKGKLENYTNLSYMVYVKETIEVLRKKIISDLKKVEYPDEISDDVFIKIINRRFGVE